MTEVYWSSGEEYEVDQIVDYRVNPKTKKREFLIKWKGYSAFTNSWEPEGNLVECDEVLQAFLASRGAALATPSSLGNKKVKAPWKRPKVILSSESDKDKEEEGEYEANVELDMSSSSESSLCVESDIVQYTDDDDGVYEEGDAEDATQTLSRGPVRLGTAASPSLSTREKAFLVAMVKFQSMLDKLPGAQVCVSNAVSLDPPPVDFTFITEFIYGKGVPRPDPAFLIGCDCGEREGGCGSSSCSCVNQDRPLSQQLAGGNYTASGRLKSIVSGDQANASAFIYECNERCACAQSGRSCLNRVVQRGRTVPLEIFCLGDARGWGVRAISFIPAGTFIDVYMGEIITDAEADRRYSRVYHGDYRSLYLFDLDFSAERGHKAYYTVDAYAFGSVSRFFNHSCSPNLQVTPCFIDHIDQSLHFIAFFASRDIREDEELCFDYTNSAASSGSTGKKAAPAGSGLIPCLCGSANCRKFVYPAAPPHKGR